MNDLIDRQAAIDAAKDWYDGLICGSFRGLEKRLKSLTSAQPEIIYCKECKYGEQDEVGRWYCRGFGCQVGNDDGSGFCADAERRTDD